MSGRLDTPVISLLKSHLMPPTVATLLALGTQCLATGAELSEFGHQNMRVNGELATGTRPLLVILLEYEQRPPFAHPSQYYENFIFGSATFPTVNGYFQEVSNSRFQWSRAGIIGPLPTSASLLWENLYPEITDNLLRAQLGLSNMLHRVMVSGLFDFATYDQNGDGHVTQDELQVLVIDNGSELGGSSRDADCVKPPGFSHDYCGSVSRVAHRTDFATLCHELTHALGSPWDLYVGGNLSMWLTLMSATTRGFELPDAYHLDPWNKMQLGWSEPRIRSLRSGGVETIPAAQMGNSIAPVILYDPVDGPTEFFVLEYRTRTSPVGGGYDMNVVGDGLAIWRVRQRADHSPEIVPAIGIAGSNYVVWSEGPPDFQRGQGGVWGSGATTPYLSWLDGSQIHTRLHVRPFNQGEGSITVEWLTEEDIWVDFDFDFFIELGTFQFPFDTLAEGLSATPYGGTLNIKAGFSPETATVNKRMTIQAYGGPITIGQ